MTNNTTVKKVMQVTEEAAPALHIPIMVGNETFVLTQQDIRRVEDIRMLTYNRMEPNGQLFPMVSCPTAPGPFCLPTTTNFCPLNDIIARPPTKRVKLQLDEGHDAEIPGRIKTVASVATQLGWSKIKAESESVFPLRYNTCTSTCGLMTSTGCQHSPSSKKQDSSCQTQTNSSSSPSPTPLTTKESPRHAGCQTQTTPSQTSSAKKEPKNSACQTQPITTSTGCNTSSSHLIEGTSTESYLSDESKCSSEEETKHPCPRCKSQQACTENELMKQQRCSVEEPCTSRKIHFDLCPQDRHGECFERKSCPQQLDKRVKQENEGFYRTVPLSRSLYRQTLSRATDSKSRKAATNDLTRPTEHNPNYEELQQERRMYDSTVANKHQ
ncbi:uncharacterized protein LOC128254755 [Drosophila gunungcola]|uniref:uncharacterized protein LOC128254755 n=1 Tax=Drosophila gunungcola TaxID=103775 RepID=UPI0022E404C6|nr:uncharacterized protein LOC128254755 [Drosophila gunungcola]